MIIADAKLLERQISALLQSNIDESAKSGLHNLLGEILDALNLNNVAIVFSADYPLTKESVIEQIVNLMVEKDVVLQDFVDEYNRLKKK